MALQVADRVQVTSTTYTTSSFTLGSAVTGFQAFTALTSGNTTYYGATDLNGNWEVGLGTYTTGALARTTILASSNSGSVVTFSGTVNVFCTYPAENAVWQGGPLGTPLSGVATNLTGTASSLTAGTANALATGNSYQVSSLGVGTAASGTAGEIRATNNVTAYYSSDASLKENIQDIPNALDIVTAIGSKTFDWTDAYINKAGGEDGYFVRKSDFGVVAQDVQKVFPTAVRIRQDGTLAVDYDKLAVLSFGAIKELLKRVEALENK